MHRLTPQNKLFSATLPQVPGVEVPQVPGVGTYPPVRFPYEYRVRANGCEIESFPGFLYNVANKVRVV
eukprot:2570996-Rhodomonas_salina.3